MFSTYAVKDLIPHGDPLILLDRIAYCDQDALQAEIDITADSMFAESDGVPAWVGLEYMGQAIAALAGVRARRNGEQVRVGFLVGTRHYEPHASHFPFGITLTVAVESVVEHASGLHVFKCGIYNGDFCWVEANLNVYLPADVTELMTDSAT